jgi:hypothetical protein
MPKMKPRGKPGAPTAKKRSSRTPPEPAPPEQAARAKISADAAQKMLERFQAGTTTLAAERARFGTSTNTPLRRVLLPLAGGKKQYMELIQGHYGSRKTD